jgi:predicted alpha/beta superfamily hydrolase
MGSRSALCIGWRDDRSPGSNRAVAQKQLNYRVHQTEEHLIRSALVQETYRIKVLRPISRSDDSERFPVLYATDSDEFFGGFAAMASILQIHGEVPRFILVGIGYEDQASAALLRMRDFWTHPVRSLYRQEMEQLAASSLVRSGKDLKAIMEATSADEFLQFLRKELMPEINARYPTLPDDSSYFGYSAGGGFGMYALFTHPNTFSRYVLGSPATSYKGRNFGIEMAEAFVKSGKTMRAKVFMSVGELEEFKKGLGHFDFVSGYYQLAKFLKTTALPGLDLTLRVFPNETHASAWTMAFTHGLRALFGPAENIPFGPEYLK